MDPYAYLAGKIIDAFMVGMNREDIITHVQEQSAAGATPQQIADSLSALADQKLKESQDAIDKAKAEGR